MRKLLILMMLSAGVAGYAQIPQKDINVDLPAMYQEVDEAIKQSPKFVLQREEKIEKAKRTLAEAETDNQRLMLLMELCNLYHGFNGDSTLAYSLRCVETAQKLSLTEVEADYQARCTYLCTFLGSQTEALTQLSHIDKRKLSIEGLGNYYRSYLTAYESLADNCKMPELRKQFRRQQLRYRDSLLNAVPEESELYYFYGEDKFIKEGKLKQALKMNDKRLNQSKPDSHQDAIIAYSRYRIFDKSGNKEMAIYWLCRSALADIRNGVMDQMSLISLAKELDDAGDFERSSRYISFTWECNRRYSPHMRSWQIAPLLSAIENNFQAKLNQQTRWFHYSAAAAGVLFLLLIVQQLRIRRLKKKIKKVEDTED